MKMQFSDETVPYKKPRARICGVDEPGPESIITVYTGHIVIEMTAEEWSAITAVLQPCLAQCLEPLPSLRETPLTEEEAIMRFHRE